MRRLAGPADCRLCERVQTPEALLYCFGTGREHQLNLLCGLCGVLDCKWMSGSARCRNHQPRGTVARRLILIKPVRALPSAPRDLVFSLDNSTTWMSGSARCRNHQPRGTVARRLILIKPVRALPSAPRDLVFSLDNSTTWMSAIRTFRPGSRNFRIAGTSVQNAVSEFRP